MRVAEHPRYFFYSIGESIYAFGIIARFFLQSALRVFVIQQQFSVRYRVIFL